MLIRSTFHSRIQYMSRTTMKTGTDLAKVNAQISTGKKILNLSDEPWATSELHQLRRGIQDQKHYEDASNKAMSLLSTTEYALTAAMDLCTGGFRPACVVGCSRARQRCRMLQRWGDDDLFAGRSAFVGHRHRTRGLHRAIRAVPLRVGLLRLRRLVERGHQPGLQQTVMGQRQRIKENGMADGMSTRRVVAAVLGVGALSLGVFMTWRAGRRCRPWCHGPARTPPQSYPRADEAARG